MKTITLILLLVSTTISADWSDSVITGDQMRNDFENDWNAKRSAFRQNLDQSLRERELDEQMRQNERRMQWQLEEQRQHFENRLRQEREGFTR